MAIMDDARHFAKAMIEAGRPFEFVLEAMAAYYGDLGREAALAVMEEYERSTASPN